MTSSSIFTAAERLHSLKFAGLGGLCAGLVRLIVLAIHQWFMVEGAGIGTGLLISMANLTLVVNGAIAILSGAVFALTYRYAIRQDKNLQLNTGVVIAFTLVRGFAQVDVGSAIDQTFWPFLPACGESLLMFGVTALMLTFAIQRQWIAPFGES